MRQILNMTKPSAEPRSLTEQNLSTFFPMPRHNRNNRHNRRHAKMRLGAVLSIELVMALPILLAVLLALVEFGTLLMASQAVNAAAHVGAREAALAGSRDGLVLSAIQNATSSYQWQADAQTTVYINGTLVSLSDASDSLANARSGDLISVTVSVPMNRAAPDLLNFVGIGLGTNELTNTYVTRKE